MWEKCSECHALEEGGSVGGPSLYRYGSVRWLREFLRDPGSPLYYDGLNKMPPLGQKLAAAGIDDLVAFLQTLAQPQVTLNP